MSQIPVERQTAIEKVMEAKALRDLVRDQIVKVLRSDAEAEDELVALLMADDEASEGFQQALEAYSQVSDSSRVG